MTTTNMSHRPQAIPQPLVKSEQIIERRIATLRSCRNPLGHPGLENRSSALLRLFFPGVCRDAVAPPRRFHLWECQLTTCESWWRCSRTRRRPAPVTIATAGHHIYPQLTVPPFQLVTPYAQVPALPFKLAPLWASTCTCLVATCRGC